MKAVDVKFLKIEILSKQLELPSVGLQRESQYNFAYIVEVKAQAATSMAYVLTDLFITQVEDNRKLASIKSACIFEFKDFKNIFKETDGKLNLPMDVEILLKGTAIATTRGVFSSELWGTYLQDAVFPLVDIASQIKADREKLKTGHKKSPTKA